MVMQDADMLADVISVQLLSQYVANLRTGVSKSLAVPTNNEGN